MIATIVVGVDGSEHGGRAMAFVADVAASLGATVVAVHGFEPLSVLGTVEPPVDFAAIEAQRLAELRDDWCAPLVAAGVSHTCVLLEDEPVGALVRAAEDHHADLVVVGARGRNRLEQFVLGSTSAELPHRVSCPVTIVP